MADEFNLSDFDTPTETEDHRVFLSAIRNAAAEGILSANGPIVAAAAEIERQSKALMAAERAAKQAEQSLAKAKTALWWDRVQQVLVVAFSVGMVLAGAGAGFHFAKQPKIEQKLYGCGNWNTRTEVCSSGWIPLTRE